MPSINAELLQALKNKCSHLGDSFVAESRHRIVAQPSGRALNAKCTRHVAQVLGEAASLTAIHKACPGLAPAVHAFGTTSDGRRAYLVTDQRDTGGRFSPPPLLGQRLAQMHSAPGPQEGEGVGKFGFDRPTHCYGTEQDNTWTSSWKEFWSKRRIEDMIVRIDKESDDGDPELVTLGEKMKEKGVYDLLFDPLEGKIKSSILHGDLWNGNFSSDRTTSDPVLFNPASYFGHNEVDLSNMVMYGGFTEEFYDDYHSVIPRFEPYYDARQVCYRLHHELNLEYIYPDAYRVHVVDSMRWLIEFADQEAAAGRHCIASV